MNQWCLQWIRQVKNGDIATSEDRQCFEESIIDCHEHGFYLVFSRSEGWVLRNEKPETLQKQKIDLTNLINSVFRY